MDKIRFTFWVTEECNLRCNYCYVSKQPIKMDKVVADQSIKFAKQQIEKRDNAEIVISFHGGEPTMNFDIIKYLTEYFTRQYGERVSFQLTTNGVLEKEHIYDYFMKNHFMISVSLDGTKECNDLNRITQQGESAYDHVMRTLAYFKKHEYDVRLRMTINASNVHLFSESFRFLFEQNVGPVAFAVDMFHNYDKKFWETLSMELEKTMDYLYEHAYTWYEYYIKALEQEYLSIKKICVGGKDSFHIDGKGCIYPCMLAVGYEEFCIGDIDTGICEEKMCEMNDINEKKNPACEKCAANQICAGEYCKIINKRCSGDYLLPSINNCKITKIFSELIQKSKKRLKLNGSCSD